MEMQSNNGSFIGQGLAYPVLPLLIHSKEKGCYDPIPEKEWINQVEKNYVFPKLDEETLLEVNELYREMRVEYLFGEFRGESSEELTEFLEYLIVKSASD